MDDPDGIWLGDGACAESIGCGGGEDDAGGCGGGGDDAGCCAGADNDAERCVVGEASPRKSVLPVFCRRLFLCMAALFIFMKNMHEGSQLKGQSGSK